MVLLYLRRRTTQTTAPAMMQTMGSTSVNSTPSGMAAEGGTLICSGILNERADEVRAALEKAGFEVVNHAKSDDWSAFTAKK